ncbi:MAG: NAD(P)H-hydrate dehydratase [Clostridiales bacterium]|nr:NAD(P)H-hydrate dehydratase [Clostridiales bacterium]
MAETVNLTRDLISGFEPQRPEDGHKNTFGTALICAGSEYMTGAAVMATGAALRTGAGLVKVFSEDKTLDAVRVTEPCALLALRPGKTAELLRKAKEICLSSSAVLIGSGIPQDYKDLEALICRFLENAENVVLDAGALMSKPDTWARIAECLKVRKIPAVITPHIGEFARLTGISKSEIGDKAGELALKFAGDNNCVVVLKSAKTLIATPDGKLYVNDAPNSGLAKGGSGDVLAGLITGFLAQGMEPYKAACSAVFIHSKAGEAAANEVGTRTMLPTDLIVYLPGAYMDAGWGCEDD